MPYTIIYHHVDGERFGSEEWKRGLEEAKALANRAVLVGTSKRVEIRDEAGALVYHYPRVTCPA